MDTSSEFDFWDDTFQDECDQHFNSLTSSQKQFVHVLSEWLRNRERLFLTVTGGPGTGKTHTVVKTLEFYKMNVIKMAPTAKIANNIGGKTIHSTLKLAWGKGSILNSLENSLREVTDKQLCLDESARLTNELHCHFDPEIVVIDEVGMVPFWLIYRIVKHFFDKKYPILVIAMGDCRQLRPVMSEYNIFQAPLETFKHINIDLKESKRFTPEYEKIINHLRHLMDQGLEDDMFDYIMQTFPVVEDIDATILIKCKRALTYRNVTVETYNDFYLKQLEGPPIHLIKYLNDKLYKEDFIVVKKNCLVTVTENNCGPVTNGTNLIFQYYDDYKDVAMCVNKEGDTIEVKRSLYSGFIPLMVGFAGTIHKYQGETIDENGIVFNFDQSRDLNLVYTALSRVRSIEQILAIAF